MKRKDTVGALPSCGDCKHVIYSHKDIWKWKCAHNLAQVSLANSLSLAHFKIHVCKGEFFELRQKFWQRVRLAYRVIFRPYATSIADKHEPAPQLYEIGGWRSEE